MAGSDCESYLDGLWGSCRVTFSSLADWFPAADIVPDDHIINLTLLFVADQLFASPDGIDQSSPMDLHAEISSISNALLFVSTREVKVGVLADANPLSISERR